MTRTLTILATLAAMSAPAFAQGDAAQGESDFKRCKSCHAIASADETIVKGGKTGPNLYGVIGRTAGTAEDYKYGADIVKAGEAGLVWDETSLAAYIEDPRAFLQDYLDDGSAKSKMTFKLKNNTADMAAYLATFSE
ncbi:c-type cytochrome [Pseudooceanicola sp.]|uniref:c-type cytochrome n=1 Tax=Pseudooceanicola sp. TaxID=1914328 RepID=UPI0035C754EF